jgi:hypothetical protein
MTHLEKKKTPCRNFLVILLVGTLFFGLVSLMGCGENLFDPNFVGTTDGAPPPTSENVDLCEEVTCEVEGEACEAATGECKVPAADPAPNPSGSPDGDPIADCAGPILDSFAAVGCWLDKSDFPKKRQFEINKTSAVAGSYTMIFDDGAASLARLADFTVVSCNSSSKTVELDLTDQEGNLTVSITHVLKIRIAITGDFLSASDEGVEETEGLTATEFKATGNAKCL